MKDFDAPFTWVLAGTERHETETLVGTKESQHKEQFHSYQYYLIIKRIVTSRGLVTIRKLHAGKN